MNLSKLSAEPQGFSLIEVLVTVSIMTVVLIGFTQMMSNNMKAQKGVQDSSDLNAFGASLQLLMGQQSACSANLVSGSAPIRFDTTKPNSVLQPVISEIDYPMQGPSGTPIPNPNNHLITSTGSYGGWNVANINGVPQMGIRVQGPANSTNPPTSWFITIEVDFQKAPANQSMGSPTGLRNASTLIVTTSGTGTVQVTGCGNSQYRTSCPSGYTVIAPGTSEALCISSSPQPPTTWAGAEAACLSQVPITHLCTDNEWMKACYTSAGTLGMSTNQEWIEGMYNYPNSGGPLTGSDGLGRVYSMSSRTYPQNLNNCGPTSDQIGWTFTNSATVYSFRCCFL